MCNRAILLYISFICAYITIDFITPYLAMDILTGYEQQNLFLAAIIYTIPSIAQISTVYLFSKWAEQKNAVKKLIFFGYISTMTQYILLYFITQHIRNALLVVVVNIVTNLCTIAYIPAIKALLAQQYPQQKGRMLGRFSMITELCYGLGTLLGGLCYTLGSLDIMLIIALGSTSVALLGLFFVPTSLLRIEANEIPDNSVLENGHHEDILISQKIISNPRDRVPQLKNLSTISPIHQPLSFKTALAFQFFLRLFGSVISGVFGPYLLSIHLTPVFFGVNSAGAAMMGIITLGFFGWFLDRKGPMILYWFGAVSYLVTYLILLTTTNPYLIFVVWTWPAFASFLATEYIAAHQSSKQNAILNMARATFFIRFASVCGQITGGFITTISSFRTTMWVGFFGGIVMTITIVGISWRIWIQKRLRYEKSVILTDHNN